MTRRRKIKAEGFLPLDNFVKKKRKRSELSAKKQCGGIAIGFDPDIEAQSEDIYEQRNLLRREREFE